MKRFRIQLVIAAIVFVCGISLMGLVYIVFSKPDVYINPGIVVSHPSPVATPHVPTARRVTKFPPRLHHQSIADMRTQARMESLAITPSSSAFAVHQQSNAQVSHVGSGFGGNSVAASSGNHSSSQRGIQYSGATGATMPMTTFVALASSRTVSQPEASSAPMMAQTASAPMFNAPPPPQPPSPLDPEHQLVEQPIGDAIIPLLLLALAYVGYRKRRLAA